MKGIIAIYKPKNITSFQAVARFRKITGIQKVGHTGTLDPLAEGMLIFLYGAETKKMSWMVHDSKRYQAVIELGKTTDSYDGEGIVTSLMDTHQITQELIRATLPQFMGSVSQIPPMFSALKKDGVRLYTLARQGIEITREARSINISNIDLLEFSNPFIKLVIECSKGTYIRTLAHDIGQALGCGAYLAGLVRLSCGNIGEEHMITFKVLEQDPLNTLLTYDLTDMITKKLASDAE